MSLARRFLSMRCGHLHSVLPFRLDAAHPLFCLLVSSSSLHNSRHGVKSTIPLCTFESWDEQVPGSVEADLVAHCDFSVEASYLFTLTMTNIATGWTECLPLRTKSAEAMLAAVKHARTLFPFPLLGLDMDNGTKLISDFFLAYCQAE